jgi:hypothetical protein
MEYLALAIAWLMPAMAALCFAVFLATSDSANPMGRRTGLIFGGAVVLAIPLELLVFEGGGEGPVARLVIFLVGLGAPFGIAYGIFRGGPLSGGRIAAAIVIGCAAILALTPWIYRIGACHILGHCY